MKKKGFALNAAIMFIAMFITKGLGAVLKIPLGNILGGEGMGYFTTAYSIFTPILAFTCSGIPTIVTQVTARYAAQGKYREIFRFRRSAILLGGGIGLAGTAVIYMISAPFAYYVANSPGSLPAILMIAPAVFSCSVTAVYRGYYEGMSDMLPTAASQIIEAAVKAGIGVGASYFVYIRGAEYFDSAEKALPYAAAAAILGVTIGEYCGTFYIVRKVRRETKTARRGVKLPKVPFEETAEIMKDIFLRSLPVAAGAAASNLISFTDLLTVSNCINLSRSLFPDTFSSVPSLSAALSSAPADPGTFLYGSYSGLVLSVYMLTSAAAGLIARCSLPKLVFAVETDRPDHLERCVTLMLKGTALIAVPISLMMAVLSEPILRLLYPIRAAEVAVSVLPLRILSLGGVISGLGGAIFTLFHAYGDFKTPVKLTLYGGLTKFLLNVALLTIPTINISGAALATVISNIAITGFAYYSLKKRRALKLPLFSATLPSLLAGTICAACLSFIYPIVSEKLGSIPGVLLPLGIASFLYLFLLFLFDARELGEIFRDLWGKNEKKPCKIPEKVVK
ncbi:MAG: oligosaccharide flippase family protein [Eubacterium sp.]|nr:oligosaccharide flippase family protein [Eubacterium sp.]